MKKPPQKIHLLYIKRFAGLANSEVLADTNPTTNPAPSFSGTAYNDSMTSFTLGISSTIWVMLREGWHSPRRYHKSMSTRHSLQVLECGGRSFAEDYTVQFNIHQQRAAGILSTVPGPHSNRKTSLNGTSTGESSAFTSINSAM